MLLDCAFSGFNKFSRCSINWVSLGISSIFLSTLPFQLIHCHITFVSLFSDIFLHPASNNFQALFAVAYPCQLITLVVWRHRTARYWPSLLATPRFAFTGILLRVLLLLFLMPLSCFFLCKKNISFLYSSHLVHRFSAIQ